MKIGVILTPPATLLRTAGVVVMEHPDGLADGPRAPATIPLADADAWIETLRCYAAAGIAHVQVVLEPTTTATLKRFAPVVDALRTAAPP